MVFADMADVGFNFKFGLDLVNACGRVVHSMSPSRSGAAASSKAKGLASGMHRAWH